MLKAAYERRASQHVLAGELGKTGTAAVGNELWKVPPPPMMEGAEDEGGASSPKARRRAEVSKRIRCMCVQERACMCQSTYVRVSSFPRW